jgi:hypothetical protein
VLAPVNSHNVPTMMRERWIHRLVITLYEHGQSAPNVSELLDMPTWEVSKIVTRAGVGRSRSEAAQITKGVDRRQIQHVRLLVDIAEDMATKTNLSADLLLDVLAYRLSATSTAVPVVKTTDLGPNTKTAFRPIRRGRNLRTCVSVCDFGFTHRCAKTIGGSGTVLST